MRKFFLSLLLILTVCANGFADENAAQPASDDSLKQTIDTTTGWGKWLQSTYKPYAEKLSAAAEPLVALDFSGGLSPETIRQKLAEAQSNYYKALQDITPPPELAGYHAAFLKMVSEKLNGPGDENVIMQYFMEANSELKLALTNQGVPQYLIDKMCQNPYGR